MSINLSNDQSKEYSEELDKNGVTLIKNIVPNNLIQEVKNEYDTLDSSLTRKDIPRDQPIIVFWNHVQGETKRIATFSEYPSLMKLIKTIIVPLYRTVVSDEDQIQLLETIIFNKPPKKSNTLHWHQDVAYFPLKPNNQVAVWLPFENVYRDTGALNYALGSHKMGIRGSTDLHTRKAFDNEDRELIPENPESEGFEVATMEMTPNDMLIHNGYTWHYSGPNTREGYNRRGLSIRIIRGKVVFDPRPGQGAAFTKQIDVKPGELIQGEPFPVL